MSNFYNVIFCDNCTNYRYVMFVTLTNLDYLNSLPFSVSADIPSITKRKVIDKCEETHGIDKLLRGEKHLGLSFCGQIFRSQYV